MDFENAGGKMLDAVLENMNVFGRIAVCGMISQYNKEEKDGVTNLYNLINRRITMRGFLQSDFIHLRPKFMELMSKYLKANKVVYIEDFADGLENAPAALCRLMKGENTGKQVITVAKE